MGLTMTYKELTMTHPDALIPSMDIGAEIIYTIKYLLRIIQD